MAALGNIGVEKKTVAYSRPTLYAWVKQISVTGTVTGGVAGEVVYIFKEGNVAARSVINNSNAATFYDLEDGVWHVREVFSDAHAWRLDVSGASVTVTPLTPGGGGSGTTRAYGFLGT